MTKIGDDLTGGGDGGVRRHPEQDEPARVLTAADELTLPKMLLDFRITVRTFFE